MQHYFTVNFSHENQKALELRTEDAKDCDEWVAAIAHARYVSPQRRQEGRAQAHGATLSKPSPQEERARQSGSGGGSGRPAGSPAEARSAGS